MLETGRTRTWNWSRPTLRSAGPSARWCSWAAGRSRPESVSGLPSSHSSFSDGSPNADSGRMRSRLLYLKGGQ